MTSTLAAPSLADYRDARRPPHVCCAPGTCPGLFREAFPVLQRRVNGKPLIYLDSAATTQKPEAVLRALDAFYRTSNANVHRGLHTLADEATAAYEECRKRVARFVDAPSPASVVILRNATAALNLAAAGLEDRLQPGDELLLTPMEHHANLVPWLMLAKRRGLIVRHVPLAADGTLDLAALPTVLGPRTRVVSFTWVSNVLGTVNPVERLIEAARRVGALVVVDAAQAVGHLPVSFRDLGADLMAFSAHKAYGPMGLGFLVGRPDVLADLKPLEGGGEMIDEVTLDSVTFAPPPLRFEAGTPNVAAAAAFPAALDLLESVGAARVREHEVELTGILLERLASIDGLRLFGPAEPAARGGLVSFLDPLVHPHDLAAFLDAEGIAIRTGHHCAQPLHRLLGVPGTARASFGLYSNRDDIDALVDGIQTARSFFG